MRKQFKKWLIVTCIIMLAIVIFATVMLWSRPATVSPPAPDDKEALYWHVMGDKAHMTFRINLEGNNEQWFRLDVWLPTDIGAPVNVDARVKKKEEDDKSVPINLEYTTGGPDPYGFEGFNKYTYEAEDNIFMRPGEWVISINITDSKNQVHAYEKSFNNE